MRKYVDYVKRVKSAITFYVSWTDKVGLVNVVKIQCLGEIGVLNAFGNICSFF